jgi:hypothetical protein
VRIDVKDGALVFEKVKGSSPASSEPAEPVPAA